jgi:hypothetical protein
VMDGLGLWIAIGMGWVKFKDGPLMNNVNLTCERWVGFVNSNWNGLG